MNQRMTAASQFVDLASYMVFPHDSEKRDGFVTDCIGYVVNQSPTEYRSTETGRETMNAVAGRHLAGAPRLEDWEQRVAYGAIAGDIFLFVIQMDQAGYESGIRKARFLAEEQVRQEARETGDKLPYGEKAVKQCWRDFQRVAHLWAAVRLMDSQPGQALTRILDDYEGFLQTAKALQDLSDQFKRSRSRSVEQLLPEDAWRIADEIPPAAIQPPPLSDWLKSKITEYRHD